jgi:hypothetical protein
LKPVLPNPWEKMTTGKRRELLNIGERSTAWEKIARDVMAAQFRPNSRLIRF